MELATDVGLLISEAAVAKDSGAGRLLLTHLAGVDPKLCAAAARHAGAADVTARPGDVLTVT